MIINLSKNDGRPLYRQIQEQLKNQILSGRLPKGYRLPSERKLADLLNVNRTTIKNALKNLDGEGLTTTKVGSGRVVAYPGSSGGATDDNRRSAPWNILINDHLKNSCDWALETIQKVNASKHDTISFVSGAPFFESCSVDVFKGILETLLAEHAGELLSYSPPGGMPELIEELLSWLNTKGVSAHFKELMIVDGCQQGIYLATSVLVEPGDVVVFPQPGYLGAAQTFKAAGARLVGVDINEDGICLDALKNILKHYSPKFIYTQPNFQNPSGISMSLENRLQLLELSYRYGVPIVEDDPYEDLRYKGQRILSLKALDEKNNVISVGSFSKILYPGLRVGWVVAPSSIIKHFKAAKRNINLHTNTFGQRVILEYFRKRLFNKHLEEVKKEYSLRAKTMIEALRKNRLDNLTWFEPDGGYFIWLQMLDDIDAYHLLEEGCKSGVTFVPGKEFCLSGGRSCLRLSFASTPVELIVEGVGRLRSCVERIRGKRKNEGGIKREIFHEELIL